MPWDLDNNRPIYLQLMEKIQQDIISGVYHAGAWKICWLYLNWRSRRSSSICSRAGT